jgi:ferredoxin
MIREIINIDEEKCNGCGLCIPNCPEGALQVIDGKARLISDLFCDGLGACIGHCPEGAILVETREAEPYDERRVMANIITHGENTIVAHLKHLEAHGETELLATANAVLEEEGIVLEASEPEACGQGGCPGSRFQEISREADQTENNGDQDDSVRPSELTQWPVQFHLIPAGAPWLRDRDLLISADCVGYAVGDFHKQHLKGKALAIACPKLDTGQDVYLEKLTSIIDNSGVKSIEVLIMQVPCCGGLLRLVQQAAANADRDVPIKCSVVSVEGKILETVAV